MGRLPKHRKFPEPSASEGEGDFPTGNDRNSPSTKLPIFLLKQS